MIRIKAAPGTKISSNNQVIIRSQEMLEAMRSAMDQKEIVELSAGGRVMAVFAVNKIVTDLDNGVSTISVAFLKGGAIPS